MNTYITNVSVHGIHLVVQNAIRSTESQIAQNWRRGEIEHIVILAPEMSTYTVPLNVTKPKLLFSKSFGNKKDWEREFDVEARAAANKLWCDKVPVYPELEVRFTTHPHLYPGVKRYRTVVTCTGVSYEYAVLVSGIIADGLMFAAWCDREIKGNTTSAKPSRV